MCLQQRPESRHAEITEQRLQEEVERLREENAALREENERVQEDAHANWVRGVFAEGGMTRNDVLDEAAQAVRSMQQYSGHPHAATLYQAVTRIESLKDTEAP